MTDPGQQSDESSITVEVKKLLKDISMYIDDASEQQKRRVLAALQDLREAERREHPRKPCSLPVTYTTQDMLSSDTIRDISSGGAFIETSEPLSVGHQITLWFSLPDREEPVLITGEVVWTPRKGIGVKFTSPLTEDLKEMIEGI